MKFKIPIPTREKNPYFNKSKTFIPHSGQPFSRIKILTFIGTNPKMSKVFPKAPIKKPFTLAIRKQ